MAYSLYVKNLPPDITIEDLIIYFQSKKSGGGDVDSDVSKLDGNTAVVVFEEKEYLRSALQREHEICGHKLEISDMPIKHRPVPKKKIKSTPKVEERIQSKHEKAYLGEVRTVIVSGICSETTDEMLKLFFDNKRRCGGGEVEKLERCSPDVAHITFVNAEDAAEVLRNKFLELEGYRLQLKEMQPELILPPDRKKLYVENINPKTTKDGLQNYLEVVTRKVVLDVQFGDNNNALATLEDEPDMSTVQERSGIRRLEGADLKISNPPVCNSVLITGLSKNTTKQLIEIYFENERNGGGMICGDIIYQKDQGQAVVSFSDPSVVESSISRKHLLNGSVLSVQKHYQFIQTIKETTISKTKMDDRDLFGTKAKEVIKENNEDLCFPDLDMFLPKQHEIGGDKLEICDKPVKPKLVPKKRKRLSTPKAQERIQSKHEKAYLDEVRTVIVSGICSKTTDETLRTFFENRRRSGGGEIKKLERCRPNVANITFVRAEDAAEVLKNKCLELESYLLQLKEKQPELILPLDKKKLYVENMNPKTTKDGLVNHLEVVTKKEVLDVQFGDGNNALVTLDDEPDMSTVQERSGIRRLEGADLKISNPRVCNSILITGLSKNTTKPTIEMYFENERHGGGMIYGDIIYQKDQGQAVVSFCDPTVVESSISRKHLLNGSVLSVQKHYQFIQTIKETTISKTKMDDRDLFGTKAKEVIKEINEDLCFPGEVNNNNNVC